MNIPECFMAKMALDEKIKQSVVSIEDLRARRLQRRMCQVFLSSPQASAPQGGTPIRLAA